jgi:hypothetical protein
MCDEAIPVGQGYCPAHRKVQRNERGTATQRGYNNAGHRRFRTAVLKRDPLCVCPYGCDWHKGVNDCVTVAKIADHFPIPKRKLVELELDDNDPDYGRGLCKKCHDKYTYHIEDRNYNG